MSKAKKAKQVLTYGAKGFYYKDSIPFPPENNQPKELPTLDPSRDQAKPPKPVKETLVPLITLDPITGKEPQEQTLEELKLEAQELGVKGWNFYKDPEKLKAKIEDVIRFQPSN